MQLNYAVVHELEKESGSPRAQTKLADALLPAQNEVVTDLTAQIARLIGQKENMAHYGVFRNDPARTQVPDIVKNYCLSEPHTETGFLGLTNDCMAALLSSARSQNLATGGYLLFVDYSNSNRRFLLVAMIKQRSGITMQDLVPTSITELDLSKLHQVARIAFDRLHQYEEAGPEAQDLTYVTFVSPKGSQPAAGYFVTALGCKPGTTARAATRAVLTGTTEFFSDHPSIRHERFEARSRLTDFLHQKADDGERVRLLEIIEVVRRHFPPNEADQLAEELVAHLQNESGQMVPAEFPVSKAEVNRYRRFRYQSNHLKVEIDKASVTRDDGGPIYFDEMNRRLVISEEDFITKLGIALQDDG